MILKGSQRGGALKLAAHLLRGDENDHVTVHELRGFSGGDLREALREAEAVAKGTRCKQHLFSLSLNPPATETVSAGQFIAAIDRIEAKLGLSARPRAIVFHEKEGRRHAHVVWSRIDPEAMKAVNLPFFKNKLQEVSRSLFLEHGWRLPEGLRDKEARNPLNFTLAEWQQAKRTKQNPERLKVMFRECWSVSDNGAAFAQALADQGFVLARGDRRGFVAVDCHGEVYSLSRWTGEKTKALKSKLDDQSNLPDVAAAKADIAARMTERLRAFQAEAERRAADSLRAVEAKKAELKARQRQERADQKRRLETREQAEALARAARFRRGFPALWDWITGKTGKIRAENEATAKAAALRDRQEQETLIARQLTARRYLQQDIREARRCADREREDLRLDVAFYAGLRDRPVDQDKPDRRPRQRTTLDLDR